MHLKVSHLLLMGWAAANQ